MNIALYLLFTVICFFTARPPLALARLINPMVADSKLGRRLPNSIRRMVTIRQMCMEETIAVCFCGAAKTTSLGIPLVAAMWAAADDLTRAFIQIPVLLYTIEQVCLFFSGTFIHLLMHCRCLWHSCSCTSLSGTSGACRNNIQIRRHKQIQNMKSNNMRSLGHR